MPVGKKARAEQRAPAACPECGQRDALIALGTRIDQPSGWLRWGVQRTDIYTCRACEAVVTLAPGT